MLNSAQELQIKIFADGADLRQMIEMSSKPYIKGLTTNPTLMRKAGVTNYEKFVKDVLKEVNDKPISFEVFADDFDEMISQARKISSWGRNVNVKIPITNTKGEESTSVVQTLTNEGIALNITAILTVQQVRSIVEVINPDSFTFVSVFAGRIADTGRDPIRIIQEVLEIVKSKPKVEVIWASPRELLNVIQADAVGCHIITATSDILNKLELIGKDLEKFSLETVQMFQNDALLSGYEI
jgi:transaldolase